MPPPYHSLHRKLENVVKNFITANCDVNLHVYSFLEVVHLGEAIEEPFLAVRCRHSTDTTPEVQLALASGSRTISCSIRIRSHAEPISNSTEPLKVIQEYRDYHDEIVGKVLDCFHRSDLLVELNKIAAVEGGIYIAQVMTYDITDNPEDRSGVTEIEMPFECNPVQ